MDAVQRHGTCPQGVHKFRRGHFALGPGDCWVLEQKVAVMGVEDILLRRGGWGGGGGPSSGLE